MLCDITFDVHAKPNLFSFSFLFGLHEQSTAENNEAVTCYCVITVSGTVWSARSPIFFMSHKLTITKNSHCQENTLGWPVNFTLIPKSDSKDNSKCNAR
jgi:hypothetical protein